MSLIPGIIKEATDLTGKIGGNVTKNIGTAINAISSPSELISSVRKMYLPLGGNIFTAALVEFAGPENSKDWRVRLSIPFNFFMGSAVFAPLVEAGGLVFPYTPSISISHQANYEDVPITHQNYSFMAYQNSKPSEITITGAFNVEDATQAQYWIAAVHFLRSASKMYTGESSEQGSPPPILTLNGYGDFVFKKVPVVIKTFSVELSPDCDYISTSPDRGYNISSIGGAVATFGMSSVGGASTLISSAISSFMGGGESHVPTKSTISVTLQPVYSREAVRNFSLQTFVNGGYVKGGYI